MAQHSRVQRLRGGATLPMVTVLLIVMLIMAMCAVDIGHIWVTKAELRHATDAAVFAAAGGMSSGPATARSRAKAAALANLVNGVGLVLTDSDIELGTWNTAGKVFTKLSSANESKANAVRIVGELNAARNSSMSLTFASIFGHGRKDLRVESVAGIGNQVDVVIVQDVTGSFSDEISYAKTANKGLIDELYANGTGNSMIGIAVFTGWGKTIQSPLVVRTNYNTLVSKNTSLKLCGNSGMPVCSGTDQAAGLEEAYKIFTSSSYTSAATPSTPKAVVLVTDGEPTSDRDGSHPYSSSSQLLNLAIAEADDLWGQKVHVYVAFFNSSNSSTAANNMKKLIRGDGIFLQTSDASKLPDLMDQICRKLPTQLLK